MSVSQVTDEVLYTGLIEMQELDLPEEQASSHTKAPTPKYMGLRLADLPEMRNLVEDH